MTKFLTAIVLAFMFFSVSYNVYGAERQNNKFGIHLAQPDEQFLKKASELVNSNGGKWGYVTLVIQENDRKKERWDEVFDVLREHHLIPIIRIATKPVEGGVWRRPEPEDIDSWVTFLDSLKWVVKDRYITLFNETNHATEWGGSVDAEGYAKITKQFAQKLKEHSDDYVVMLAGFDASAPSSPPNYQDEGIYLRQVVDVIGVEDFNKLFGALSSHSYPNPGFAGSPNGFGKGTVRTYQWELDLLRGMGVKELPVFITETGWSMERIAPGTIASYMESVYENVWLPDDRIKAVTPFVLTYLQEPFINFSWMKSDDQGFAQYDTVKSLPKTAGDPEQVEGGTFQYDLPNEMVVDSSYHFTVNLKNTGQALWSKEDGYYLAVDSHPSVDVAFSGIGKLKPNTEGKVEVIVSTTKVTDKTDVHLWLMKGERKILDGGQWSFVVRPLPQLSVRVSFYPKLKADTDEVELQVFDKHEQLVYKQKNVRISEGKGYLEGVPNVVPGEKYRVVALRPYYLPRQKYVTFSPNKETTAGFPIFFPLDFDKDGAWTGKDMIEFIENLSLISLWIPSTH